HANPRTADALGYAGLGQTEFVDELAIGDRFFERRQVGAHDVLDQRELQHRLRCRLFDDNGDDGEVRQPGCPPAPLPGNQGKAVAFLRAADDEGLDDAVDANRVGELLKFGGVETGPRLVRVRGDRVDVDVEGRVPRFALRVGGNQGAKTAAQPTFSVSDRQ